MARRRERVSMVRLLWCTSGLIALTIALTIATHAMAGWRALDVAVTKCGQEFAGDGYLAGDLVCTGMPGSAVVITGKGSLDFRGFTITGSDYGIVCLQSCNILGPGMLIGAAENGVGSGGALLVRDLSVVGSGGDGLVGYEQVRVIDSNVSGNGGTGVVSKRVLVRGSTITGNANFGAMTDAKRRVVLRDSQVTGNGLNPTCGLLPFPCADIASGRRPRVRQSSCDTSYNPASGEAGADWSVCTYD